MQRIWISLFLAVAAVTISAQDDHGGEGPSGISIGELLSTIVSPEEAVRFPATPYRLQVRSSRAVAFGVNGFLPSRERGDKTEYVLFDAKGPGIVVSMRVSEPKGQLRIYVDDSPAPVIDFEARLAFNGSLTLFTDPFATPRDGTTIQFPIPYSKNVEIACTESGFDWDVECRRYPDGTALESFTSMKVGVIGHFMGADAIKTLRDRATFESFLAEQKGAVSHTKNVDHLLDLTGPGRRVIFERRTEKPETVTLFEMDVMAEDFAAEALDELRLEIECDGKKTVDVPLGSFFGGHFGFNQLHTYLMGHEGDVMVMRRSSFPMPYRSSIKMTVTTKSEATFRGPAFLVRTSPYEWNERSLRFHAHEVTKAENTKFAFEGRGLYVGYGVSWASGSAGFEERIIVDDVLIRSLPPAPTVIEKGGGTRQGWAFAYRGRPTSGKSFDQTAFRWRGFAAIPFNTSFAVPAVPEGARMVVYYYAEPKETE